jgi:hypothetical protein
VGGQGQDVQLTSSNIAVVNNLFSFDVTVQNLIDQPMATPDGTTPDPDGVRVFFEVLPTTTVGTGQVTVANADGVATFTAADQPYYQYDGILLPNEISAAREWQFTFDPNVETFVFTVLVFAEVQYTEDWIDLSDAPEYLLEGQVDTIDAIVRDPLGNPVSATIEWSSSAESIATVNGSGIVTAMSHGFATITATSGSASSEVSIGICPIMIVGEVITATTPVGAELCFGGDSDGAEYTYMPLNLSTSAALTLTTTGSGIAAVTGPPSPTLVPTPGLFGPAGLADATEGSHIARLTKDALSVAGRFRMQPSALGQRLPSGPSFSIIPGTPTVGDLWDLNVEQGCTGTRVERVGRVASLSDDLIIVEDTLNPAGLTTAQYDSLAAEFDTIVAPTLYGNFGAPTDLDSNTRLVAFFSTAINPQVDPTIGEYGYFAVRDLFLAAGPSGCSLSNDGEIVYLAAPDPTGAATGTVLLTDSVRANALRSIGHELQHLINASEREVYTGAAAEEAWLDEGLSTIAEELLFYAASGLTPLQDINNASFGGGSGPQRIAAFNAYSYRNFLRLQSWLAVPDSTAALRTASSTASQGALWAFLRYAADRTGGDQSLFWSGLVSSGSTGLANLQTAIGGVDPGLWLRDFTAAMYADDAVGNLGDDYQTQSWNYRSLYSATGTYPLLPRPLTNDVGLNLSYAPGGGTSFIRFGVPGLQFATITSLSAGDPPAAPFQLIVVRTR